ncbi:DEAD/DEAH box helicase [Sulfuritalea sp.]|uniref:DEAD/DEAH box helicase n=1 Tax=Sulfuritalea sp. TaxID=2480090 RepID=UPI00286E0072|nr:DEAD/DEAH box helicase [Sulfuritalea sp.]
MPAKPISADLPQGELLDRFDSGTLQRGAAYAAEGRVRVKRVEHATDEIHVEAEVQGTRKRPYEVDLWLETDPGGAIVDVDNSCMCPMQENCKHVVAVLQILQQSADLGGLFGHGGAVQGQQGDYPEPSAATLDWLGSLDKPEMPRPTPLRSQPRVVYLLQPGTAPSLSLGKSRPLKKGGFGKPAIYRPQPYDLGAARSHRDFILDEDIPPLRLFLALQAGGGYFYNEAVDLSGETGALLLRLALRTGRLYLDGLVELPLATGAPRPLGLLWTHNSAGLQQLSFDLPPELQMIPTSPPFYLDTAGRMVGELQSELSDHLLQQLLQAPPLNEADAPMVRQRLAQLARERQVPLPLPDAPEAVAAGKPSARLVLTQGRFRHLAMNRLHDDLALAVLHFDYPQGLSVIGVERPSPFMRQRVDGQWQTLQRDLEAEGEVWRLLQSIGLESWQRSLGNYQRLEGTEDGLMPLRNDAVGWLSFLNEGVPALERREIPVEFADDFPYCIAQAEDWFVAVEESVGSDWFDLDLGVRVAGERVSLVPPLLRLLREQPDLLGVVRGLEDSQTFPVALDARRILPVPAGRLKAWLLPLLEFLDEDRPRLSRHNAAALAGLDELPTQWIGGEELRDLGRRLRDFSGMTRYEPAPGFTATLRPYQQIGLDWLQFLREYGLAGILADDMGLGKTVQTLAHLHLEKTSGRADRPSLVVATTSLMANWRDEAAQFTPDLKVLILHGKDRAERFGEIGQADLVLTTYPLLVRDRETLLAQDWHLLVMDEAQFIKNPKAQAHQVARSLQARHRLSLTGTPLENHLGELWAQFDFLMPGLLGNAKRFTQVFRTPIEKLGEEEMRTRLGERVRPFLLRRTKEQVLKDLPPRTEMVRWVEIEGGQRDLYESLRVAFDRKLRLVLTEQGVGRSQIMIFDALLKLRQICCDPRLVKLPAAEALVKKGHAHSAKLATLMEMLDELLDEGRKVLLFSQFTSMLGLIELELEKRGIQYARLTGQTRDRETPIKDFQEGRVPLFLISLKAGGTGLNLTAADTVIHYDPWWNPAVEEQATARAHRIGQDKPVFVYKLMTQGTVEEKILALQNRKRGLADQLLKKGGDSGEGGGHLITASDLDVLFQPLA